MVSKLTISLFLNTAWAYPLFLWNLPINEIKSGFYRFSLSISTILWGLACIILLFNLEFKKNISDFLPAFLSFFIIGSYTFYIWKKNYISLYSISAICIILAGVTHHINQSIIFNIEFLNPAYLIGVLILSNVLFAMILGHWYLNVPNLKITRLKRIVSYLGILLVLRLFWNIFSIYSKDNILKEGMVINGFNFLTSLDGIFLWIAFLFGIIAPLILNFMTSRTLEMHSTQSATGLLYINLVLILMSEMIFKYYLIQYKWIL